MLPCVQKAAHGQGPVSAGDRAGRKAAERAGTAAPGDVLTAPRRPQEEDAQLRSCDMGVPGLAEQPQVCTQRGVQGLRGNSRSGSWAPGPQKRTYAPRGGRPRTQLAGQLHAVIAPREGGHSQGLLPQRLQLVPVLLAELLGPLGCIHRARLARHGTFHHLPGAGRSAKSRPSTHTLVGGFSRSYW